MTETHQQALDLVANGDWNTAHQLIQHYHHNDELACLIHAYLHLEEGDIDDARHWYSQAGQLLPDNTTEQEFERLYQITATQSNQNELYY